MHTARTLLDTISPDQHLEGDKNFININRHNLLTTAFDEIKDIQNLRFTLEGGFYGEQAHDSGGPMREFFTLAQRLIKEKYFQNG